MKLQGSTVATFNSNSRNLGRLHSLWMMHAKPTLQPARPHPSFTEHQVHQVPKPAQQMAHDLEGDHTEPHGNTPQGDVPDPLNSGCRAATGAPFRTTAQRFLCSAGPGRPPDSSGYSIRPACCNEGAISGGKDLSAPMPSAQAGLEGDPGS